ncbi:MAG: hypothetical protein OEM39_06745 [Acidimicrobiia bacterium]|nr:hypothetical protein [Acidimicrobiia bacterium]
MAGFQTRREKFEFRIGAPPGTEKTGPSGSGPAKLTMWSLSISRMKPGMTMPDPGRR